jgi:hypothetical protein
MKEYESLYCRETRLVIQLRGSANCHPDSAVIVWQT